jgi:hypothetical protein
MSRAYREFAAIEWPIELADSGAMTNRSAPRRAVDLACSSALDGTWPPGCGKIIDGHRGRSNIVLLGHVRNGMIVADDPVELPEGASVRIEITVDNSIPLHPQPRQGGHYAGQIWMAPDFDEWPADLQESLGMIP